MEFMNNKMLIFQSVKDPKLAIALKQKVDAGSDKSELVMKSYDLKDNMQRFTFDQETKTVRWFSEKRFAFTNVDGKVIVKKWKEGMTTAVYHNGRWKTSVDGKDLCIQMHDNTNDALHWKECSNTEKAQEFKMG